MSRRPRLSAAARALDCMIELLERPGGWTQKAYARNQHGSVVESDHPDAVSFCLVGAATHCAASRVTRTKVLDLLSHDFRHRMSDIVNYNDRPGRTQQQVVARVKRARKAVA